MNPFSTPLPDPGGDGGLALPPSVESLKALFAGLLCELPGLEDARIGLSLLGIDLVFFALGGKATARGEPDVTFACGRRCAEAERLDGDRGDGERGELGDGDVDFEVISRKAGPFDGDRESERRNCLIAEVASTWCIWVGDGKCSVPPASRCGEKVATIRNALQNQQTVAQAWVETCLE